MRRVLVAAAGVAALTPSCAASRDSVPESRDVRVASAASVRADEYYHVARRRLGVVALADFRGVAELVAKAATERLADTLEACATDLDRAGKLAHGAARLVAEIGSDGTVQGVKLTTSPGAPVTANALLCLASPMKLLAFPPKDVDAIHRGIAVEATWGTAPDAGRM